MPKIHKYFRLSMLFKLTIKALIFPMLPMYLWYYETTQFSSKARFLNFGTMVIWGQIILCCGRQSCASWDV